MEHTQKGLGLLWGPDTAILSCLVSRPGWKVEMNSFRSCPHQTHTNRVSPTIFGLKSQCLLWANVMGSPYSVSQHS